MQPAVSRHCSAQSSAVGVALSVCSVQEESLTSEPHRYIVGDEPQAGQAQPAPEQEIWWEGPV